MDNGIHFIAGLPRSGSTLLAALLKQNPRFHAGMSGPMGPLYGSMLAQVSAGTEFAVFIDNDNRRDILAGLFDSYYRTVHPRQVVFDTNRMWTARAPSLLQLFPQAKIICCVRQISWIIDSIERLVRKNAFQLSRIFGFDPGGSVYTRANAMLAQDGLIGSTNNALREAFYSEIADRLILVQYQSLAKHPRKVLSTLYDFIGEKEVFDHDLDRVEYDADEFDERLGTPGLHTVKSKVEFIERETILPPDLFNMYLDTAWWAEPKNNLRGVRII